MCEWQVKLCDPLVTHGSLISEAERLNSMINAGLIIPGVPKMAVFWYTFPQLHQILTNFI